MPTERAPLTDKEQRIMVQAQLMGLSTASMVKIGNRLRAIEQEQREINDINESINGYTWDRPFKPARIVINAPDGTRIEAVPTNKSAHHWYFYTYVCNITVISPDNNKVKEYKNISLHCHKGWRKKLMPNNSKELYAAIRWHRQLVD